MSCKPRPVHDDGALLLHKFKARTRKQEKVERNGNNNKFDPHTIRDGTLLNVTVDKDTLLAKQAAAVRVEKPAEDIHVKPWYLLSFDEVIELHSEKKKPKKKEVVPHPAFGVSSKPRFENMPSSSTKKAKSSTNTSGRSPSKTGTPAAIDDVAAEEEIVKSRRLRVSDLQSEIAAIDKQIQKVEGDSQRYTSQMQRIMAAAEKSDADLVSLKQNAVRTLSNARSVVNKVIQKNRQHDSLKRTLVQDIKKWESQTRKALNPYAPKDFDKMSQIVETDRRRRLIRFRIRVALFKFAARVMHKDPTKRNKWRLLYTLGANVTLKTSKDGKSSSTRGSPSSTSKTKQYIKTLSRSESTDDIDLRKASVLSTTVHFKPNLGSGSKSSVVGSVVSSDSNVTTFTMLASAATASASAPSLATTLRPSMITTNHPSFTTTTGNGGTATPKRSSTASVSPTSGGAGGAASARTSSVTFSAGTKPMTPLANPSNTTPPPPPPLASNPSPSNISSNSTSSPRSPLASGVSPNDGNNSSTAASSGQRRPSLGISSKDEVRGIKRGSFSQLFGAVG